MMETAKAPTIEVPRQEYTELKADETTMSMLIYYFCDYLEEKDDDGAPKHYYNPEVVNVILNGRYL